jgi:phosphoglycolate phosphatase
MDDAPGSQHPAPSTRHPFRLFVFDLDGTLIDSRRDIANAANQLLVQCGAEALPEETIGRMVGDGAATLVARAFKAAGLPLPDDALRQFLAIYDAHLTDHTRAYPEMAETLETLRERLTLAVLTNKPRRSTLTILERLRLDQYFHPELVLGGDGPLPRKPDPAGLLAVMQRAGTGPADTLLVGDSPIDWRTARAAGTTICLARYGFGFEGFSVDALGPEDHVVDSPAEIVRLLEITTF